MLDSVSLLSSVAARIFLPNCQSYAVAQNSLGKDSRKTLCNQVKCLFYVPELLPPKLLKDWHGILKLVAVDRAAAWQSLVLVGM